MSLIDRSRSGLHWVALGIVGLPYVSKTSFHAHQSKLLRGQAAFGDWTTDSPGVRRKIVVADLPQPFETRSSDNGARVVR